MTYKKKEIYNDELTKSLSERYEYIISSIA